MNITPNETNSLLYNFLRVKPILYIPCPQKNYDHKTKLRHERLQNKMRSSKDNPD